MGSVATPPNVAERDDDDLFDGDGIFDEGGDIFDDDGDFDSEGVFADDTSIFSTPSSPSEDHRNPITTKTQEMVRYEGPTEQQAIVRQKSQLVAKFDANGLPWVCRYIGGKPIEKFRKPTQEEFEKLRNQGRVVKGGIGDVPAKDVTPTTVTKKGRFANLPWKWLVLTGVVGAGGFAAYKLYRKRKVAGDDLPMEVEDVGA
jgi:hypothetical protein